MKEHTRLARARRGIERRLFLKALGLGMSAPVAWNLSRSAIAQAQNGRPKRLMVFFMPHGAPPEHYNPVFNTADPTNFSLDQQGVSILGSLEPFKQNVNVLQGFKYLGGATHEGILTVLSNSQAAGVNDTTTARTSFEHVIANELGVRPLILGAVPHRPCGLDKDGMLFWDGQPVVPEQNPAAAYDQLFGGGGNAGVDTQLRSALTALTARQVTALQTEVSGLTGLQSKLSIHLESIQSIDSVVPGQQSCDSAPDIPAVEAIRTGSAGQVPDASSGCGGFFLDEPNFPDLLQAQLQVAAQALICNAAPVVGVQPMYTNADVDFGFMGSNGAHHSILSHTGPQTGANGPNLQTRAPFANAQKWLVDQLVTHVVSQLNVPDPADPGRTVLDNTLIYMFSEIGEGQFHTSASGTLFFNTPEPSPIAYMPIVTIGGGGGAIRPGQVVRVNNDPQPDHNNVAASADRPAGDIYLSLAQAMGVNVASFGNSTNPVTEILT